MGNCEARLADGEAANEGHDSAFKLAGIKAEEGLQAQLEKLRQAVAGWMLLQLQSIAQRSPGREALLFF